MRLLPVVLTLLLAAPLASPTLASDPAPVAVSLAAPPPSWYTEEVHARVLDAAEDGLAYDVEAGAAVAVPLDRFIRPGARIVSPAQCTAGFVFGSPGSYQFASGGCGEVGENVVLRLAGPTTLLVNVGKVVKKGHTDGGTDWILVSVDPPHQEKVDPCVATLRGPQGVYLGGAPAPMHWMTEDGAGPREGVLTKLSSGAFYGAGPFAPGDAGAPFLVKTANAPFGEALGVLTGIILGGPSGSTLFGARPTVIPAVLASCGL